MAMFIQDTCRLRCAERNMPEENVGHFKGGGVRYTPASAAALKAAELLNEVCPPRVLFGFKLSAVIVEN